MGTTEEKLAYLEETKEKLAQGLAAQGLTPAGTFRAMAEQVAEIPSGTPLPSLTNPGTAADLLSGKRLIDGTGRVVTGSMPDIVPQSMELESGQTYTIPRGYHSGSGTVTAKEGGGSFAVPLVVTVAAGATVTATNGTHTVTGVSDGTATLILPSGGTWTLTATKADGTQFEVVSLSVLDHYTAAIPVKSRLPDGYTEILYASSELGANLRLAKHISNLTRILMVVECVSSKTWMSYISTRHGSGDFECSVNIYSDTSLAVNLGMGGRKFYDVKTTCPKGKFIIDIDFPSNQLQFNGEIFSFDGGIGTAKYLTDIAGKSTVISNLKIYSVLVFENNVKIQDLVPCINQSKECGFFDLAKNMFYTTSYEEYPFIAGPIL